MKIFNRFCKERNIRWSTRKGYFSSIKKYEEFHKQSISELLEEARVDEDNRVPLRERRIKKRLLNYRTYLLNSNLSTNTVKSYFVKIRTFYQHFEIELPKLPDVKYEKDYETNYLDLPNKEHIRLAVEISSINLKAII